MGGQTGALIGAAAPLRQLQEAGVVGQHVDVANGADADIADTGVRIDTRKLLAMRVASPGAVAGEYGASGPTTAASTRHTRS